jgi:glycosyltransferase involved in cell wall biosynthesis
MKVIEVINVDFALYHFVLPLMRGIRDRGHEVIGACADGPLLAQVRAEGFRVEALPFERRASPIAQLKAIQGAKQFFQREQPGLVHAHMPLSGFAGRLGARAAGVPRIAYTCHGFLFNQPSSLARRATSLAMEWLAGQVTDIYFTVSTEEAADARRLHLHRNPIGIGNGRDPAKFHPNLATRARIRGALGVAEDRVVVVIVARLVAHKGFFELAAAMRDIDAELWVVGERLPSDRGPDIAAMLRAAGLGDRLRLLGYRADTADVIAAADIFTLPSHFEGLPMSIIEAMLTGLPVIATDISGPREQVVSGETGILVPPRQVLPLADALRSLVGDASLRALYGAAGRTRALTLYDESVVRERTLDLLGL